MRVTPLEIRQKDFEKHFRGYNTDEVDGFLASLSQEWERILDENKELRVKLEASEREMMKLREVETSLYKTLKTAEVTGANVVEQARKDAELSVKEAQHKSEVMLTEAKMKAKTTIDDAEVRARQILSEMEERLKMLTENYKRLESSRTDLLSDLKHIASDLADKVERERKTTNDFNPDRYLHNVRSEIKNTHYPHVTNHKPANEEWEPEPVKKQIAEESPVLAEGVKKYPRSFFDEIG
jgi:cell division initiation protein